MKKEIVIIAIILLFFLSKGNAKDKTPKTGVVDALYVYAMFPVDVNNPDLPRQIGIQSGGEQKIIPAGSEWVSPNGNRFIFKKINEKYFQLQITDGVNTEFVDLDENGNIKL